MAGIDKTYVKSWEDYVAVRDFCQSYGIVKDDFGNTFCPLDFLAEYEEFEFKESLERQKQRYIDYYKDPKRIEDAKSFLGEDWEPTPGGEGEIVIWNTPTYFDIWLIRNCPLQIIQDRLKQQYSSCYEDILERRSEYDTYQRPKPGKHFKVKLEKGCSFPKIKVSCWWGIQVWSPRGWLYDEELGLWSHWLECRSWNTNTMDLHGTMTKRKLARVILSIGFPPGVVLQIFGRYHRFFVEIKK